MLLALAWWRRRRHNRRRRAQWGIEERQRRPDTQVNVPPYVPWPGEDPLTSEPDDDRPPDPHSMN
jgi:hypothetical protein